MARPKTYQINETVFNEISTHRAAYMLGYLYADAHIDKGIELNIKADDVELIENLKDFLGSTHPIKSRTAFGRHYVRYAIAAIRLARALREKWGIPRNKHNTLSVPLLSEELMPSFILGLFDGDGSICLQGRDCTICFAGGHDFLFQLKLLIEKKLGLKLYLRPRYEDTNRFSWMLEQHGNIKCKKLIDWMFSGYGGSLKRKKDKAMFISSLVPKKMQPDQAAKMWALRAEGLVCREIAKRMGASHHAVRGAICKGERKKRQEIAQQT